MKIGDIRLDTMETSKALTRALAEAVSHKVDLINMSFGESVSAANKGFFVKMSDEVVNKHGCIFLSSAGNAGPALSTAGAPGASSDSIIGIGAYVSAAMMRTCYSMPEAKVGDYETKFTWSSVGPALDGGAGAHITAPGGAITCVPNWTLAKSQLMNGTSMSSPNACGNCALLLSGLKADGIGWSKHRLQRALTNSARHLDDCTERAQGSGLVQVDKAFDYLVKHAGDPVEDVEFRVATRSPRAGRGIYLRDATQMDRETTHMVAITPCFHEDTPKKDMIDFETKFKLVSDQPSWASSATNFVVASKVREFKVTIDTSELAPGEHYAHIYGYDAKSPERGPLFRVPISVTKPAPMSINPPLGAISVERGMIRRFFFTPPPGSTWMDVVVKRAATCGGSPGKSIIVCHTMQLVRHRSYAKGETKNYLRLQPGTYDVISRKVDGQSSVEVCIALYWSELQSVDLEVDVTFKGLSPNNTEAVISPGGGFARIELTAPLADVDMNLAAKLSKWCRAIRPMSASLYPLDARQNMLEGQQLHELLLEFKVTLEEAAAITVRFPTLQDQVYEAEMIGGPMVMVFDSKKKVLGYGDLYTSPIKAPKGDVVIRAFVRHTNAGLLKSYEATTAVVERNMVKPATLKCYGSVGELTAQRAEMKKATLSRGALTSVYVKEPEHDQLPKETATGDFFTGSISYEKEAAGKIGADGRPGGYALKYFAAGAPKKAPEPAKPAGVADTRTDAEKLAAAIKDLKIKTIAGLAGKDGFAAVHEAVVAEYSDDLEGPLELAQCKLHHLDSSPANAAALGKVVAQADVVIGMIDQDALAGFLGVNHDVEDPVEVDAKEANGKKKATLVDALTRKALATEKLEGEVGSTAFDGAVKDLKRWETLTDDAHLKINLTVYESSKQFGLMLKAVDKALKKNEGKSTGRVGSRAGPGWGPPSV